MALRVTGERILTVPPLDLPAPDLGRGATASSLLAKDYAAVRLFADRARASRSDFELNEQNIDDVVAICQRVDGLPLGIELAAARVATFPPRALLAHMDKRLPMLAEGMRDAPTRQQTMRNAISWSYDLLAPTEQALFRRLSIFSGGFMFDDAEAISGLAAADFNAGIATLVEGSLLNRAEDAGGCLRSQLLETVREFGLEHLIANGDYEIVAALHAGRLLALAERAEPELRGPNQEAWTARLDSEIGNIRQALRWFQATGAVEEALRLTGAIGWWWSSPGRFHEGRDLLNMLIAMPSVDEYPAPLARALETAGDIADWLGDGAQARIFYERAMLLYRELGEDQRLAGLNRAMGSVAMDQGDYARATTLLTDARSAALAAGDQWEVAAASNLLGTASLSLGNGEAAIEHHQTAIAIWRSLDDPGHVLTALASLGVTALGTRHFELARRSYQEALELSMSAGDPWFISRSLVGIGCLVVARGSPASAARLLGVGNAKAAETGIVVRPAAQLIFARFEELLKSKLDDEQIGNASREALEAPFEAILEEARIEVGIPFEETATSPQQSAPNQWRLTERELEVLRLIATGMTDRQISEELFLARRTASKHVESILMKLGVPSRSAAAATALRQGLI
jgi:non-specific serine/threonine protein kinase